MNIQECETILFWSYISKISDANSDVRISAKKFGIYGYKIFHQ